MTHILRKLFCINRIYSSKTTIAVVYDSTIVLLLITLSLNQLWDHPWLSIPLLAVLLFVLFRMIAKKIIVAARNKPVRHVIPISPMRSEMQLSVINYELKQISQLSVLAEGPTWKQYDTIFNYYRRTKYGTFLSKQVYYSVFEIQLRRHVPHLIFDSKRAKGQQFRYLFVKTQRLSFEGDFDQYFRSYAPDYYEIDTLSFITPEVMHALISASDYDIELVGDRLFLYGPLLEANEYQKMAYTGNMLAAQLNDNLDTYRDSYIATKERKTDVMFFGRQLLKTPYKIITSTLFTVFVLVILIAIGLGGPNRFVNQFAFICYAIIIYDIYSVVRLRIYNKRLEREFVKDVQFAKTRQNNTPA